MNVIMGPQLLNPEATEDLRRSCSDYRTRGVTVGMGPILEWGDQLHVNVSWLCVKPLCHQGTWDSADIPLKKLNRYRKLLSTLLRLSC